MPTCSPGGVRSPPAVEILLFTCGCTVDLLLKPVHTQVEEERGRERTRLPPARGGGKEERPAAGVEVEKEEKVEKVEMVEMSEQPAKPPAAPRRKKK